MQYNSDDIRQLSDVAHCRFRPSLYVGQTEEVDCVNVMLQEAMCMALQSAIDGIAKTIRITQMRDGRVQIWDNGPTLDPREKLNGSSVLELMLTRFSACTDAKSINRSYFNFGIVSANALSRFFVYETTYQGRVWRQEFRHGEPIASIECLKETSETYRQIEFFPDSEVLPNTRISYVGFQRWFNENCKMIDGCSIFYFIEATDNEFDVIEARNNSLL